MNVTRAFEIFIKSPAKALRKELSIERHDWLRKKQLLSFDHTSDRCDAIFLWVPKTAGTSLWNELYFDEDQFLITLDDIKTVNPKTGTHTFGHFSIFHLLNAGLLDLEYFKQAWKFTIVRNPYDRAVSNFEYLKSTGELPPSTTFPIFCQYLSKKAFEPIGLYNYQHLSSLNPQVSWLKSSSGEIFADFIGKYENLINDTRIIFDKLGVKCDSLQHKNPTDRKATHLYYSISEIKVIQKVYNEDFKTFNYDPDPDF